MRCGSGPRVAASHGFRDPLHQRRFLGAGEEPLPGATRLAIDAGTDVGEDFRHLLHFLENGRGTQAVEEALRIGVQTGDQIGVFQQGITGVGKQPAQQPGLAGAART